MAVILAWNLSSKDLSTFLTTLGIWNSFPKIKGWVDYVLQLKLIKWLILLHLYLLKARSERLEFWILDNLNSFIGCLENGPYFLYSFSRGYFLELLFRNHTENDVQCSAVGVRHFDLCIISISRRFFWFNPTNLHSCHTFSSKDYKKTLIRTF